MSENKPRNIKADVIRGFAIITVILGHCIQNGNGWDYFINSRYWSNKVYQFVYSFHMPLFMLLAGWYAYYSLRKLEDDRKKQFKFLGRRAFTYVFPIFFWTVFEFVRGFIMNSKNGSEFVFFDFLVSFISYFLTNLWFLWAILICLVIVFVMHFYLEDNVALYVLGFLVLWFTPDAANLGVYKYLMPYYIGAFYLNKYLSSKNESEKLSILCDKVKNSYKRYPYIWLIGSAIIFVTLFLFYDERAFIYLTGYRLSKANWYKQIVIDIYRFVIGLVGSVFFMILWDRLTEIFKSYKWPVLSAFGKNSLGVYILQGYYILIVMAGYTNNLTGIMWYHIPIEVFIISAVSLITAIIIGKIPVLKILVGKV